MNICRVNRDEATRAKGVAIVIDVIRAFSVAGYAFAGGARGIWLVRAVEEAQALRTKEPEALLAGEVNGRLIPGFDFNNSPFLMAHADVAGRQLIQRTGAGTQGAVNASGATYVLLCALTNASATAAYARRLAASTGGNVTLVPTGSTSDFTFGNEDELCADYVEALLRERADASELLARDIAGLKASGRFDPWKMGYPDFPEGDIAAVLAVDRFDFAMVGSRREWQGITYLDAQRVNPS